MFYTKENGNITIVKATNVFTVCPECEKEIQIDLSKFLKTDDSKLLDSIFCNDCSKKYL